MSTLKVLATHQIVQRLHPRPVTEKDERAMIAGRVLDATLARLSHEARTGRRPTATALLAGAESLYEEELAEADLDTDAATRQRLREQVAAVLKAFRGSPLFGLARPRSRLVVINDRVGVYVQPDYWDGRARIYEMKSYAPVPIPPDVRTQLRYFQLGFPGFETVLVGLNRHRIPVPVTQERVPPPTPEETEAALRDALRIGLEVGEPKVRAYLDNPAVAYTVSEAPPSAPASPGPSGTGPPGSP